ncbi:hypothetical protein LF1_17220 [Rubripirellula obstinata]|uniref:Uncharacterized protein n=1 Tax=Rubripirellula obstinata TaxID=406547 RepID=A0A5B1CIE2_9BACT|nr:hypothetical protein [Rubripirellula obstinata]KAA1259193.1 hypothetical protein LF1_17220 [Rubripirellula obstinata]
MKAVWELEKVSDTFDLPVHQDYLIIPYAMSDYATTFATIGMKELLSAMA